MTEDENVELTEDQKAADAEIRRQVRVQAEETANVAQEKKERRLSRLSGQAFRDHVREKYGYDPY
jgi:hypothetical protein